MDDQEKEDLEPVRTIAERALPEEAKEVLQRSRVWVNSKWLTSDNLKLERRKDKPVPLRVKVLWGLCPCAEPIYEGDSVGMRGDHAAVVCYACWLEGKMSESHLDCAGLKLPDATLSN